MGIGKTLFSKAFRDVNTDEGVVSLTQYLFKKQLKKPVAWGVVGGAATISAGVALVGANNSNDLGTITPHQGTLSNMVSGRLSPTVSNFQQGKNTMTHAPGDSLVRGANVDGDLVFALHNMR